MSQSILQFPDQPDQAWARIENSGVGGKKAMVIDASGEDFRNRVVQRELVADLNAPQIKTVVRLKSTLTVSNPAYAGFAIRHRGYQIVGDSPSEQQDRLVWENDLVGEDKWHSAQTIGFEEKSFFARLPWDTGADYVSIEMVVRGISGQVIVDNITTQAYYSFDIPFPRIQNQTYATEALQREEIDAVNTEWVALMWARYVATYQERIAKGKRIALKTGSYQLKGHVVWNRDGTPQGIRLGAMLKFRHLDQGNYDYYDLGFSYVDSGEILFGDFNLDTVAQRNYDQVELMIVMLPKTASASRNLTANYIECNDLSITLQVSDFVESSQ